MCGLDLNQCLLLRIAPRHILQAEHAAGADFSADAAAYTGGPDETGIRLSVGSYVDAHLAIVRTEAAGDAHVLLDGDAEATEFLGESELRCHWAKVAAPDAGATKRVEPDADCAGENGTDPEPVGRLELIGDVDQIRVLAFRAPTDEHQASEKD